jgi:hypothetical protein
MNEYTAPERYVWWNCSLLIRHAITSTAPAIEKGTGKVVGLGEVIDGVTEGVVGMATQLVPFEV